MEIIDGQGKLVGHVTGAIYFWDTLSYKARIWAEHIEVQIKSVKGEGVGSSFNAPLTCNDITLGDCQTTGTGSWAAQKGYVTITKPGAFTGELGFGSAATSITSMSFSVTMTIDNPYVQPTPFSFGPDGAIRCDSESYFQPTYGGCAYPIWTLNVLYVHIADPKVTEAAKFMLDAQKIIPNHIGEIGYKALTRNTSKSVQRRNHRVACAGITSPPGNSCDEYPFASTNQGASLVPPGYYVAKSINALQNSQVGSNLSSFLLKNRILAPNPVIAPDPFYVDIIS